MNVLQWILRYFDRGFLLAGAAMYMAYAMGESFTLQHSTVVLAVVGYFVRDYKIKTNGK